MLADDELLRYANYYMDEEEMKQKQVKEKVMVAQTALAQGAIVKMQGVGMRGGMNVRGTMRGHGRGMFMPRDRMNVRINFPDALRRFPCHGFGEFGHFVKHCQIGRSSVRESV